MELAEYQTQMARMVGTYGPTAYTAERIQLIWKEVGGFSIRWFTGVIDGFIGTQRQPPLVDAFALAAADERERQWKLEKEKNARAAKEFFHGSILTDDDRSMILKTIIKRVTHGVPDDKWASFQQMLNAVAEESDRQKKEAMKAAWRKAELPANASAEITRLEKKMDSKNYID